MRVPKIICDRCGEEIKTGEVDGKDYIPRCEEWYYTITRHYINDLCPGMNEKLDLCPSCYRRVHMAIDTFDSKGKVKE